MSDRENSLQERMAAAMERQAAAMEHVAQSLDLLIEAMADDEPADPDAPTRVYMDGSPCR